MAFPFTTAEPDVQELVLDLALLLVDGFDGSTRLLGNPSVRLAGRPTVPYRKETGSTFLFFGLKPGDYTIQVRSAPDEPYYLDVDIPVTLPMPDPRQPAYPDPSFSDPTRPPDDPAQPAAYRAQRALAALRPGTSYPFPGGATLVRGRVLDGGNPLADATVKDRDGPAAYRTAADGEFVIAVARASGATGTINLRASHAIYPDRDLAVEYRRGTTVAADIAMRP